MSFSGSVARASRSVAPSSHLRDNREKDGERGGKDDGLTAMDGSGNQFEHNELAQEHDKLDQRTGGGPVARSRNLPSGPNAKQMTTRSYRSARCVRATRWLTYSSLSRPDPNVSVRIHERTF
jgi:hypothetical protein